MNIFISQKQSPSQPHAFKHAQNTNKFKKTCVELLDTPLQFIIMKKQLSGFTGNRVCNSCLVEIEQTRFTIN